MLTPAQAATINYSIMQQLNAIGEKLCPPSKNNTEGAAWNYYVASIIEKAGKAHRDKARKEAIKQGVMFDHEKEPKEPGDANTAYDGDVVRINYVVRNPSTTVDGAQLYEAIMAVGLIDKEDMATFKKLYADAHKTSRPAHVFTAALVTS